MNRIQRKSLIRQVLLIAGVGCFFFFLGHFIGIETHIIFYSWFLIIIGAIIYNILNEKTKDHINNEEEKISLLYEEFNYLMNCIIDVKCERNVGGGYITKKYGVRDIIVSRPRKIQVDEWEVSIEIESTSSIWDKDAPNADFKILNISDAEFDKIIDNKKELYNLIHPETKVKNLTIINPDFYKK